MKTKVWIVGPAIISLAFFSLSFPGTEFYRGYVRFCVNQLTTYRVGDVLLGSFLWLFILSCYPLFASRRYFRSFYLAWYLIGIFFVLDKAILAVVKTDSIIVTVKNAWFILTVAILVVEFFFLEKIVRDREMATAIGLALACVSALSKFSLAMS